MYENSVVLQEGKNQKQTTKRTNMMNNTKTDLWNIMLRLLYKKGKHSTAQVWVRILVTFALLRKISLTCWFQNSCAKILCGVPVSHLLGCWLCGEPAAKPPVHLLSMPSSLQQQNKICLPVRACLKMLTILLLICKSWRLFYFTQICLPVESEH